MNKIILLAKRPIGKPTLDDFKFATEKMPVAAKGEILLKTIYVSVDPYLRGRMNDARSYVPPFALDMPIQSAILAQVTASENSSFKIGDFVSGNLGWKEYQCSNGDGLAKIDTEAAPLSAHLGILGMTGITAYLGLTRIGKPKPGETIVVSGAGGAVGSVVGQIGKLLGCTVVGITGSDEKVALLQSKFKFDHAINYKTVADLAQAVKNCCPKGVDVYFDNVGGTISDAVLASITKYARLPLCGAISLYNDIMAATGPRLQPLLLTKSATMTGFIVSDFAEEAIAEAKEKITTWLKEGKLTYSETILEGFDKIPHAFLNLFEGTNEGKMIVKV